MDETPKRNCWEVLRCGREPGGGMVGAFGVCPAAAARRLDGINDGRNGGRACWAVAGTYCDGSVQGSYAAKAQGCVKCHFYIQVCDDQGEDVVTTNGILERLFSAG